MSSLLSLLRSNSVSKKIEATYAVTRDDIKRNPSIIDLMRDNLKTDDDDLLEITIMRLGIRAADVSSLDKIMKISSVSSNYLVLSACIYAMSALTETNPLANEMVMSHLESMKAFPISADLKNIIQEAIKEIDSR